MGHGSHEQILTFIFWGLKKKSRLLTFDAVHSWVEIGNLSETSCAIKCSQSLKLNSKYDFFLNYLEKIKYLNESKLKF